MPGWARRDSSLAGVAGGFVAERLDQPAMAAGEADGGTATAGVRGARARGAKRAGGETGQQAIKAQGGAAEPDANGNGKGGVAWMAQEAARDQGAQGGEHASEAA